MDSSKAPSTYGLAILNGLQDRQVWQGQHDERATAKRRARNRMARATRRQQRARR